MMTRISCRRPVVGLVLALAAGATFVPMTSAQMAQGGQMKQAMTMAPPAVGDRATDFSLTAADGTTIKLSAEWQRGPLVLVLLRGWPGYQCPFCVRQYGEFLARAKDLDAMGARVVWVYPGGTEVKQRADAFAANKEAPANFRLTLDPNYAFTTAYRLRWDAPSETAYPSTFVIDKGGVVRWALISKEHGGRAPIADVLKAVEAIGR